MHPARFNYALALFVILFFASLATVASAQQNIPRPEDQNDWVVDQTNTLTPDAIGHLNDLCNEVHETDKAEMAVVIVPTTGTKDYEQYALELFNHWGIGDKCGDNGILVFVAKNDRTARIVLGEGIDTPGQQRMAQMIFEREMMPEFRAGNFSEGIYDASFQSAEQILGIQNMRAARQLPKVAVAIPRNAESTNPLGATGRPNNPPATNPKNGNTAAPTAAPVPNPNVNPIANRHRFPDPPTAAELQEKRNRALAPFLWLAGGGMGFGGLALIGGRYMLRFRDRKCPKCEAELVLLNETVDDEFLETGESVEERIKSVNYDVWACLTCEDVIKLRFGTLFTRFSKCPKCRRKTKSKIKHTMVRATQSRGGVVQVTERCANCDYHNQYTYRTPRLPDNDSNSGFGSGSSRSRSSSRRSRSSSSRRSRSFGGGRSRGGGGGGRW